MHYAEQAAKAVGAGNMSVSAGGGASTYADMSEANGNGAAYTDPSNPTPNEFRARFHRPLVAPSPFGTFTDNQQASATTPTTSTTGSGPPSDPIDPHLTAAAATTGPSANGTGACQSSLG
jgi:hypothetical protein